MQRLLINACLSLVFWGIRASVSDELDDAEARAPDDVSDFCQLLHTCPQRSHFTALRDNCTTSMGSNGFSPDRGLPSALSAVSFGAFVCEFLAVWGWHTASFHSLWVTDDFGVKYHQVERGWKFLHCDEWLCGAARTCDWADWRADWMAAWETECWKAPTINWLSSSSPKAQSEFFMVSTASWWRWTLQTGVLRTSFKAASKDSNKSKIQSDSVTITTMITFRSVPTDISFKTNTSPCWWYV